MAKLTLEVRLEIIDMYQSGIEVFDIIKKTGKCRRTVYSVLRNAGVEYTARTPVSDEEQKNIALWKKNIDERLSKASSSTYSDTKLTFIDRICRESGWLV